MHAFSRVFVPALTLSVVLGWSGENLPAQQTTPPKTTPAPAVTVTDTPAEPEEEKPVVVKRQAMRLVPRDYYRVPLQLSAAKMVQVTSPIDGIVREVRHKSGSKVEAQGEIVRLDSIEQELLVERAKANYRAAQIEVKRAQAAGGDKDLIELAEAKAQAAKAELDLASYHLDQTSIRAPFDGLVFRIKITPGQVVRAGEVLATVGDTSVMTAELPVDRKKTEPGKQLAFQVESEDVAGKVESILPPVEEFERLRELVDSVATGVVVIENSAGKLHVGQTVYSALVPRNPVSEVPNSAIANVPTGEQKVQVVRGNVLRDVQVEVMGGVGPDRSFVSGPFDEGDEVVVSISRELPDGTLLRPHAAGQGSTSEGASTAVPPRASLPGSKSGASPAKKSGF